MSPSSDNVKSRIVQLVLIKHLSVTGCLALDHPCFLKKKDREKNPVAVGCFEYHYHILQFCTGLSLIKETPPIIL